MEARGVEPLFPRCDRGVFPLHHAPVPASAIVSLKRWGAMKIPPDFALSGEDAVRWDFWELELTKIAGIHYKVFSAWIRQVPVWLSIF